MSDYPRLPPRLTRIFPDNPVFFVTFCTHRRRRFLATNSVNAALADFAIDWTKNSDPIWQRGFFDHVLRSEESYGQKWNYVRESPVRARLVMRAEDWPYSGEIVVIDRV